MGFLSSLIPALIVLGMLIIIHEFGHFVACRLTGVRVEKFSIGFGPEIFHWQGKETRFAVSLLPLGGFVKPAGESASEVEEQGAKPGDYLAAPLPARILIVVAGVAMNYLLAYVLFVLIFLTGRPVPGTVLGGFVDNYPAKTSELRVGDRVVEINGTAVRTWADLTETLEKVPDGAIEVTVEREGKILPVRITPKTEDVTDIFGKPVRLKRLGILPSQEASHVERYSPPESLKRAWETEWFLTVMTHKAIFYLVTGRLSLKAVSGPIGIISMTGSAVHLGLPYLLQLTAVLSVSLAVINLLPIPALDGGHLVFLLIEGIRRRQVSLQVQERATQAGFFLLLMLMVFIIYNDLVNMDAFAKLQNWFHSFGAP